MNNNIIEYIRTFVLTVLFAFFVAAGLFAWLINNVNTEEQIRQDQQEEKIDIKLVDALIEKNKKMLDDYASDYRINLRLGLLYEVKNDYQNAEAQYKQSIEKAPYNQFKPVYELAKLYILIKRYEDAAKLMNDISEKPQKKLIEYKADVFLSLANKYFEAGKYNESLEYFRKAQQYYNLLKDKEILKYINNNIASCLVYIAQNDIRHYDIDTAISYLEDALKLVNAPIIKYHLALLYIYKNPNKAYRYFDEVFKQEPRIINYETYYSLLSALASEAEVDENTSLADLYRYKMEKIKKYYTGNILSVNDVKITDVKSRMIYNKFFRCYKAAFAFKIRNISIYDINTLYAEIVVRDEFKTVYKIKKELVNSEKPLESAKYTDLFKENTDTIKYKKQPPSKLYVDIYVSKQPDNNKMLIDTIIIEKEKKERSVIERWLRRFAARF